MMKHRYFIFSFLFLFVVLGSCNLYNPAEPVPSYIHIQKIDVVTDSTVQGTRSSNITDAWVYIDGVLIGAYELPVTLPVLNEGAHVLKIKPGIKVNGIANTRAPYPFYQTFTQNVTLTRGQTLAVSPVVSYVAGIDWQGINSWSEDFESSSGIKLDSSTDGSDVNLTHLMIPPSTTDPKVYEGQGSGYVYLDATHNLFETMANNEYILPHGDSPVFLELNYRGNHDFVIGLFAYSGTGRTKIKVINLRATPEWKKTYVYLSPAINATNTSTLYRPFIGMFNDAGANDVYIALDNIKMIHF